MFPELGARPGSAVTVWGMDPMFRHSTVSPAFMVISVGTNRSLSFISTTVMFPAPVALLFAAGFA